MAMNEDEDDDGAALLEQIADALHGTGTMPDMSPEEMLERLNVTLVYDANDSAWETSGWFDVKEARDYLDGVISDGRMDELENGSPLTAEETAQAKEEFRQSLDGREYGRSVYLYALQDRSARSVCFISAHGDGGDLIGVTGPFASGQEARESRNDDPDDDCMTHIQW